MKGYTIEQVRDMLSQSVLEVEFTKVNGESRTMLASTNPLYIPEADQPDPEGTTIRPPNPTVLSVIDTAIGEWRSIRFDSLNSMRVAKEYASLVQVEISE